jgi:hypothetical protein
MTVVAACGVGGVARCASLALSHLSLSLSLFVWDCPGAVR